MKIFKSVIIPICVICCIGCEEEVVHYDFEKYKFVSFVDSEDAVGEVYSVENESAYPIYLRYDGSVLEEDFTVSMSVTGNNAQEGNDFNIVSNTVLFKAGEIKSEPFEIMLIDDLINSPEARSLEISIESVSNPNIDIGVGKINQSNTSFLLTILDDECSETISIFETTEIVSSAGNHTVTGMVNGSVVTLNGTLIDYGPFPNAELAVTLTPTVDGASSGTATFNDYDSGTDNDGYMYQFRQNGEGTYDVCAGVIHVVIDIYYESGGDWVFWYTSTNTFSLPES